MTSAPGDPIPGKPRDRRQWLALLPGIGVALLPKVACPACWPAYAGLLSALGVGFLMSRAYLLPLTVLFLGFATAALFVEARKRRRPAPFWLGTIAAITVLVGKFEVDSGPATFAGIGLLVICSMWSTWPDATGCSGRCPTTCGRR